MSVIAIAYWKGRVSPVFDVTRRARVFKIENGAILGKWDIFFNCQAPAKVVSQLVDCQVDTLICGAISRQLAQTIRNSGIHLIPFIAGCVDQIITAWLTEPVSESIRPMPGCDRVTIHTTLINEDAEEDENRSGTRT